jgi:glycosyltransferase involved in cell wall biosynthesis
LDAAFQTKAAADILLIDDGSSERFLDHFAPGPLKHLGKISILRLRRNVGHQRAIAIGLAYAEAANCCDIAVVMDGDGEDRPEDVPRLIDELLRLDGSHVVFAERTRRSEGVVFVTMYALCTEPCIGC